MAHKLLKWPNTVRFSRGPKGQPEYSPGGPDGETVEVPQIDEELSAADFMQSFVNLVGNDTEAKQIINRRAIAEPAIRDGQNKFKSTWKKSAVIPLADAIKDAIQSIKDYVPVLVKDRGTFIAEAAQAKNQMDALKAARAKIDSGEGTVEEFQNMLEALLAPDSN